MTDKSKIITKQNDVFRKGFGNIPTTSSKIPGQYVVTQGILNLNAIDQFEIMLKIREFNEFNEENDPHGEHDFGKFEQNTLDIFWKIDYYDVNYEYGSDDPTDLNKTKRVLTTMLACEY